MLTSVTKYTGLPRSGRSLGMSSLQLPLDTLVNQFTFEFIDRTLLLVLRGEPLRQASDLLEEHGLAEGSLTLKNVFDGCYPAEALWDRTLGGVGSLLAEAEDLCAEDGTWTETRSVLREAAEDFLDGIGKRLCDLKHRVDREFGLPATVQLFSMVRRQLQNTQEKMKADRPDRIRREIPAVETEIGRVSPILKSRGILLRTCSRNFPAIPIDRILGDRQRLAINRLTRFLNELQSRRLGQLEHMARRHVLDDLLGNERKPGILADLEADIHQSQECFAILMKSARTVKPQAVDNVYRVNIVDSVDTVLDPATEKTVGDLYFSMASEAGRTPQKLARQLRQRPLKIGRRMLWPDQWHEAEPDALMAALERTVRRYLGCDDADRPLQPAEPRTAMDHIARIDLLHKSLRPRLNSALTDVLERSRPYLDAEPIAGVEEIVQNFLFSYPPHRKRWLKILQNQTTIAEPANAEAYALRHPYRLDILGYQLAAPVGAMRATHKWSIMSRRAERRGIVKPHVDRRQFAEIRVLAERTRSMDDCRELFLAGKRANVITRVGDRQRYAINRDDERLRELFAPSTWSAAQITGETVQALLRHDVRFTDFLAQLNPRQTDLRAVLGRLKLQDNCEAITDELTRRKVMLESGGRFYVSAAFRARPLDAPRQLLKRSPGALRGLSEQEFLTALLNHDLLYSIVFFGVQDAWQLGWISETDVPASVVEYTHRLL